MSDHRNPGGLADPEQTQPMPFPEDVFHAAARFRAWVGIVLVTFVVGAALGLLIFA